MITLYDLIDDFLKDNAKNVTYGTSKKNQAMFNNIIKPNISNKNFFSITEIDCRNFRERIELLNYTTKYKNMILSLFKSLFKYARKYYKLKNDPSYVIEPFKRSFEEKMKQREKELTRVWQVDEFNQFIKCVNSETYEAFFNTLFYTGMRLGEIQALTWKDFKNGEIQIVKSLTTKTQSKSYEIKEPKSTSSIRNVQVGKNLETYLNKYKEKQSKIPGFNEDWFMFGNLKPLASSTITREKDRAIKKSGVKRISIHDFTHPYVKHTTKIFSLRLMNFQAQAYPDARRKTRGACQLHRGGQNRSPVRPFCNRTQFPCLPPQLKKS